MKKIIALILALVMALSLVACGGEAADEQGEAKDYSAMSLDELKAELTTVEEGKLTVVKDLGLRDPYVGQTNLVSGEIAEDFAMYFTASEQTPSLVSLGVLVDDTHVVSAGGLIIQMLPNATNAAIASIENSTGMFMDISETMREYHLEGAVDQLLMHLQPKILEKRVPHYRCDCSRERIEGMLVTLGKDELEDMIETQHGAEVDCHFCLKRYKFNADDLKTLLQAAIIREGE